MRIAASMPWQYGPSYDTTFKDADGAPIITSVQKDEDMNRATLQDLCWNKFHKNPQVNTSIRGLIGRLTGAGFEVVSDIYEIQQFIEEITFDPRNRLYHFWPKYVGRHRIEGELFLCFTVHANGFIEIDFLDPSIITGGSTDGDGIIFHETKGTLPLGYIIDYDNGDGPVIIPSIFLARFPELKANLKNHQDAKGLKILGTSRKRKFQTLGGFTKFIVSWDTGLLTKRSVGHLQTTLEWLNHYENLKKYEIDHKKSAGAYVWSITFDDPRAFRDWLKLSDEDKAKTGIMAKKTPGSTLMLPPGMKITVHNPNLPNISDSDTDILHMITAGLNEPEDVSTGQAKGTFASVKASRGPMSDRISDEVAYFERFLKHDFWGNLFFLRSSVTDFPTTFEVNEAIGWSDNEEKTPIMKKVKKKPEMLIDICFPTSEDVDYEGRAKAFLGVKHGSTNRTLGISNETIAKKMGVGSYRRERLRTATENETMPKLESETDQESVQEITEGEPAKTGNGKTKLVKPNKGE